jgi:hypothetical protein
VYTSTRPAHYHRAIAIEEASEALLVVLRRLNAFVLLEEVCYDLLHQPSSPTFVDMERTGDEGDGL